MRENKKKKVNKKISHFMVLWNSYGIHFVKYGKQKVERKSQQRKKGMASNKRKNLLIRNNNWKFFLK